jgi:hypothetical protein
MGRSSLLSEVFFTWRSPPFSGLGPHFLALATETSFRVNKHHQGFDFIKKFREMK